MAEPAGHVEVHQHAEHAEVQHTGHVEAQPAQKVEVQHTEKVEVQGTVTGGSCCPPGSEGKLKAAYTPRGTNSTLGDLPIYTVGKGNKAIIFAYDVFGVTSGRTVELCDQLADAGFLVILPDFIRGDPYFSDTDFSKIGEWFGKYPWDKINADLTTHVYPYLESKAVKSIGMVGCCWGAATVFRASGDNKTVKRSGGCFGAPKTIVTPRLSAGVSFHPTLSADLVEEVGSKINCPQLVLPAGNDPDVLKTGGQLEKILKEKLGADKVAFQDFPDMAHGWVPRGDISKPEVARDVKSAMDLATAFFKKHL